MRVGDQEGPELDEESVVARAQDGDVAAFEQLVDLYQGPLFRLALRMLDDRGEAEEIVQETLITAWRQLPSLESPGAFGGWAYQVATNRCLDRLRQRTRRRTDVVDSVDLDHDHAADDRWGNPQVQTIRNTRAEHLARLITELGDAQRACWLLREIHGRSYAEIATTLSITETAVRGRIARARQQLAEGMTPWR